MRKYILNEHEYYHDFEHEHDEADNTNEKVGEGGNDQRQRSHILLLHTNVTLFWNRTFNIAFQIDVLRINVKNDLSLKALF